MLSALSEWPGLAINCLLLVPTPPVFSYYSDLVIKEPFQNLIFTIARTELAVCVLIQFMSAASAGFSEAFGCNSRLVASTPCLIVMSSILSDLIKLVGIGSILHGNGFDLASSFST